MGRAEVEREGKGGQNGQDREERWDAKGIFRWPWDCERVNKAAEEGAGSNEAGMREKKLKVGGEVWIERTEWRDM